MLKLGDRTLYLCFGRAVSQTFILDHNRPFICSVDVDVQYETENVHHLPFFLIPITRRISINVDGWLQPAVLHLVERGRVDQHGLHPPPRGHQPRQIHRQPLLPSMNTLAMIFSVLYRFSRHYSRVVDPH
jgi:hypothetical protein